jgi:hypothetical protein
VFISLVLFGGWKWWRAEDDTFVQSMFRPYSVASEVRGDSLIFRITDTMYVNRLSGFTSPDRMTARNATRPGMLSDHGKLMHLFLVSEHDGAAFAHLHPQSTDTVVFAAALPPIPPGRYRVYADIVSRAGFTETLRSAVTIDSAPGGAFITDADDSFVTGAPAPSPRVALQDGSSMLWLRDSTMTLTAGVMAPLRFVITTSGANAPIENYMGMRAHAVVSRDDGEVFVHLHPTGTISMAAQQHFLRDTSGAVPGTVSAVDIHAMHNPVGFGGAADTVEFPYAFPQAGRYYVWVQVRRQGRVLTGAYSAEVLPPTGNRR